MLVFTHVAAADTIIYKTGTIKAVDLENNTFTIVMDRTYVTKTYAFPAKVNIVTSGLKKQDKSLIEPGMTMKLKFAVPDVAITEPKEMTMKGTVVKIDRDTGVGTLRVSGSYRTVPFRFAEGLEVKRMPMPGDEVVFTYVEGQIDNLEDIKLVME